MVRAKTLALITLLASLAFSCSINISRSSGENWLDGFTYRKSHVVENATGAGTNYQVNLTVWYGSGSSSGNTVYLNSHSQADFDDVRFTEDDGDTELDYWRESYNASSNATFWVEIADSLESDDVTIYLYYGNATVSTTSSIFDTFPFADDFEDGSLGAIWTTRFGTPSEAGGLLTLEGASVKSSSAMITGHKFRTLAKINTIMYSAQIGCNDATGNVERAYFWTWGATLNRTHTRDASTSEEQTNVVYSTNWVKYQYNWEVTDQFVKFYMDKVLKTTHTTRVPDDAMEIRLSSAPDPNDPKLEFEWLFIAKYVSPEPVHGSWGIEETEVIISYLTIYHTAGGIVRVNNATVANGTENWYTNNTVVEFEVIALVEGNLTYGFDNYTYAAYYNYSNPFNLSFTITENTTLWTYFVELEEGGVLPSILFTGLAIVAGTFLFTLFLVWEKKER